MLLKDKYKQILVDIFAGLSVPVEVWAYGSRVDGTAHEGSDLDSVVFALDGKKLPIELLMELKEKIRGSNIPILVELFDLNRLPESFRKNIADSHETLYHPALTLAKEPESEYRKENK